MEFQVKKRTPEGKKKLMLWISTDLIERVEAMKPMEITVQEAMRQIIEDAVTEHEVLNG